MQKKNQLAKPSKSKRLVDAKLKEEFEREMINFSLLGEISSEIKFSFKTWCWQKEVI